MVFLKDVEKVLNEDVLLEEIIELSKDHFNNNESYVLNYLNKRAIGLETVKEINTGLLSKGLQVMIPRLGYSQNIKYVVNQQVNNSLFFPTYRGETPQSFVGIIRNTRNDSDWRYKVLKINKDGNNFFHSGVYPESLILVEGMFDKLRLIQAELFSIPTNGTQINIEIVSKEFSKAKEIILFLDGDEPAKMKTFELVYSYLVGRYTFELSVIKTPEGLDPCDLNEEQIKLLHKHRLSAKDYFNFIIKNCINEKDKVQLFIKNNLEREFKI